MIIGVAGYAKAGKDTVGNMLLTGSKYNFEIKKWAYHVKLVASILLGVPVESFEDQDFKDSLLGPEWNTAFAIPFSGPDHTEVEEPMTVRQFLQKIGTDALRDNLHDNVWINALMKDYKSIRHRIVYGATEDYGNIPIDMELEYPNWIITDTRFPNEAKAIKERGGVIIRVERPGFGPINDHPSETALDDWEYDIVIYNDGTIDDLHKNIVDLDPFEKFKF